MEPGFGYKEYFVRMRCMFLKERHKNKDLSFWMAFRNSKDIFTHPNLQTSKEDIKYNMTKYIQK